MSKCECGHEWSEYHDQHGCNADWRDAGGMWIVCPCKLTAATALTAADDALKQARLQLAATEDRAEGWAQAAHEADAARLVALQVAERQHATARGAAEVRAALVRVVDARGYSDVCDAVDVARAVLLALDSK